MPIQQASKQHTRGQAHSNQLSDDQALAVAQEQVQAMRGKPWADLLLVTGDR
jgi:hypothetical protein